MPKALPCGPDGRDLELALDVQGRMFCQSGIAGPALPMRFAIGAAIADVIVNDDDFTLPLAIPAAMRTCSLKCRSGRCAPPVHMIKPTEWREVTPYKWVHSTEKS